jgi:hypothetical protein
LLTFESRFEVVDFKGDMRDGADEFVNGAAGLEAHPLDAVGTGAEAGDEETERLKVRFVGLYVRGWNANVVIAPPELLNDGRRFVIESAGEGEAAGQRFGRVRHGHLWMNGGGTFYGKVA